MLSKEDKIKLYETLLAVPGMLEPVKIDMRLPRKHALLLSKVIERGLTIKHGDEKEGSLLDLLSEEILAELRTIPELLLEKAELTETNERLKTF